MPDSSQTLAGRDFRLPGVEVREQADTVTAVLHGQWSLLALGPRLRDMRVELLALAAGHPSLRWDLRQVDALDGAAALLLWQVWRHRFPPHLMLRDGHRPLFEKWLEQDAVPAGAAKRRGFSLSRWLARPAAAMAGHLEDALVLLGQVLLDALYLLLHPARIPWGEISDTLYQAGAKALGITGLVGVLIGVVTAYQSVEQLKLLGAEIFVVDILGLSISRELGPLLAAILVAGRSGSSMTARLGAMRLTQELDAMTTLGLSHTQRLVIPRVTALTVALPLLTIWTDIMAMLGGLVSAQLSLDITYQQLLSRLPDVLPVVNLSIGLGKAAVFGALIGMTASHFGLRVKPNTYSLSMETTKAVVTAITLVIVLDAVFSVVFQDVGFN